MHSFKEEFNIGDALKVGNKSYLVTKVDGVKVTLEENTVFKFEVGDRLCLKSTLSQVDPYTEYMQEGLRNLPFLTVQGMEVESWGYRYLVQIEEDGGGAFVDRDLLETDFKLVI